MFRTEAGFVQYGKKHGQREAVELVADINQYTRLFMPNDGPRRQELQPGLGWQRSLFDHNDHFVELSNMDEESRSLILMLVGLLGGGLMFSAAGAIALTTKFGVSDLAYLLFVWIAPISLLWLNYVLWPYIFAGAFFTSLCARYRFNRTTRKVYVLRPKKYGGNVILDWDRVRAHVNWRAPNEMKHGNLRDPVARKARQSERGGRYGSGGLVLYWPPFDKEDNERRGEEVLWVGPRLAGENHWQYIRTFMEEGIDKVPEPNEFEWLRKGFHTPAQHTEETELGASRALDRLGRSAEGQSSVQTDVTFLLAVVWAPLHTLAERLCYWPTFPEEWNSDCGQNRREDGIGPEEPLRWTAREPTSVNQT